jgi:hypothetical protein
LIFMVLPSLCAISFILGAYLGLREREHRKAAPVVRSLTMELGADQDAALAEWNERVRRAARLRSSLGALGRGSR